MKIKIMTLIALFIAGQMCKQSKLNKKDILIKNGEVELPGTLSYSKDNTKLMIWVHGSGNIDRDGNQKGVNVNANYIKQFREEINKQGIAFFSYDKRTSNPKNAAHLKGIILDDFVSDVKAVINHFKQKEQFEEIILLGHSQGSLVAMLASEEADKYISIAGPSVSIEKTIIKQVSAQSAELGKITEAHFKELKETGDIKEVNPMLLSMFAKQNLPFLKNWMAYDPVEEIKRIKIPTLIINGTKDIQVSVEDAKILHQGKGDSTLDIIENMNHVLKDIQKDEDNMKSYYSPDYIISRALVKVVADFVNK